MYGVIASYISFILNIGYASICFSLVTRSSHLTIPNIIPIEIRQTARNTVHATQMGLEL